jgi:hypothetical protein
MTTNLTSCDVGALMGAVHARVGGVHMCMGLGMGVRAGGVHGCR